MKKVFIIVIIAAIFSSCAQSGSKQTTIWTPEYELNWRKQLNNDMKERLPDDDKRANLVSYMLKRFKIMLPKGLESVSKDSVSYLARKIGVEYGYLHEKEAAASATGIVPTRKPWTREIARAFREAALLDSKPEELKANTILCDCYISELKKAYPDSVMLPVPHDTVQKIAEICYNKLKIKK